MGTDPRTGPTWRSAIAWLVALVSCQACQLGTAVAPRAALPPLHFSVGAVDVLPAARPGSGSVHVGGQPASSPAAGEATVTPETAPAAPSASGGGSGGGGNAGPATPAAGPADLEGDVFEAYPEGEGKAIGGARVAVGRGGQPTETVTDDAGHFQLADVRPGEPLVVSAPGYPPSMLAGWSGTSLRLHLTAGSPLAPRFESYLPVKGDVLLGDGVAPGAIVIGGNRHGTSFGPLIADERGHFEGMAVSYEGAEASDVAVFALIEPDRGAPTALGLSTGGAIGEDAPVMRVRMAPAEGDVHITYQGPDGARFGQVVARAPNGLEVALGSWTAAEAMGNAPFFTLAGGDLVARVQVESADRTAHTVWRQKVGAPGEVHATLLAFPQAHGINRNGLSENSQLTWAAVDQAEGYRSCTTAFVAGDNLALADAGDGGPGDAAGVRLGMPWRARGRYNSGNGNWETYICDRANNRIRLISSAVGTAAATGYLALPVPAAAQGKPIYQSTLTCFCQATAGNLTPPTVALVPERLKNGNMWSNATVAANQNTFLPLLAPDLDMVNGPAFPLVPSTTSPWNFQIAVGGGAAPPYAAPNYQWRLPSQAIFTSSTDANFQHLRIGMKTPTDTTSYFYPTSAGTISSPNAKSPDFYTNRTAPATAANYIPRVDYKYGNRAIQPILSPPTIYYQNNDDTQARYVYLMNSNAIWRYNTTTPAAFISNTNGADVAFSKSAQGRDPTKGNIYGYSAPTSFQFNSTPPLVGLNGHIYSIDIWATSASTYTYYLNDFDGDLATTNSAMYVNGVQIAAGVPTSSPAVNSGIYIASDVYIANAFFGLADGKIYCLDLNSTAP